MRAQTFTGATVQEALDKVKAAWGEHAVILHTKKRTQGNLLGLAKKDVFEVLAAVDEAAPEAGDRKTAPAIERRTEVGTRKTAMETYRAPSPSSSIESLRADLNELMRMVTAMWHNPPVDGGAGLSLTALRMMERLKENGVEGALAQECTLSVQEELLESGADEQEFQPRLLAQLRQRLVTCGAIEANGRCIFFVGPTGGGKTTTLAKLAADFALLQRKRVALITADTYRIAAVEQLKVYADIIGVPLQVVCTPSEMAAALRHCRPYDLVLVDTAGRSPKNDTQVSELALLTRAGAADEVHLVLPAPTHARDAMDAVRRFSSVGVDRLLFTKLDETSLFGTIANVAVKASLPISYVTYGQDVPEDIAVAEAGRLAELIVNGEVEKWRGTLS